MSEVIYVQIPVPISTVRELADLGLSATLTATPRPLRQALGEVEDSFFPS